MEYAFERRDRCPICCARGTPPLVDLPFVEPPISTNLMDSYGGQIEPSSLTGGRYVLVGCPTCQLVYQRDVPGPELLEFIYDTSIPTPSAEGRAARGLQERRRYAFQIEELLKYFGTHPADVHVLDYGMGWGNWLQMAQAYGCRAAGAELSTRHTEAPAPGIDVVPYDELPADRFHFINTEQVFEHLVDPLDTGQRLVAALRPGGILRISVPNGGNIHELLRDPDWSAPKGSPRSLNRVAPLKHLNCFTHDALMYFSGALGLRSMHYPVRQFLEPWERIRFAMSAVLHTVRRPKGTMLLFTKA